MTELKAPIDRALNRFSSQVYVRCVSEATAIVNQISFCHIRQEDMMHTYLRVFTIIPIIYRYKAAVPRSTRTCGMIAGSGDNDLTINPLPICQYFSRARIQSEDSFIFTLLVSPIPVGLLLQPPIGQLLIPLLSYSIRSSYPDPLSARIDQLRDPCCHRSRERLKTRLGSRLIWWQRPTAG